MHNRKLNITESDRNGILDQYYGQRSFIFDNYMSIDGRYIVKDDELYDLKEQKEWGNVFSLNNIKRLVESEEIKTTLNNISNEKLFLFEVKQELFLKKTLITEQEDIPQTDQETTPQSKVAGGILWTLRKLKSLLWSVGGMAVDALLVASGIGKTVQWIPWALVLGLDAYEWTSGDYGTDTDFQNSSTLWKSLEMGFSVIGMMSSGPFAKAAKTLFEPIKGLKNLEQISQWVSKTPKAKAVLTKMSTLLNGATNWITKGSEIISQKMPTMGKWLGSMTGTVGNTLKTVGSYLGKILSAPGKLAGKAGEAIQGTQTGTRLLGNKNLGAGLKSGVNTAGLVGGIEKGANYYGQYKTGLSSVQLQNIQTLSQI